jgi:tRNA (mo5U34)-methyltransferase
MSASSLRDEVWRYGWYHTLDLGQGVVTPGMFDHRRLEHHFMLPDRLTGMRCLDVGTMDGYWAFAMERRGAAEVVAVDIEDPDSLDWPYHIRSQDKTMDETKPERFALACQALGSSVRRELRSVYDVDVDLGQFDLVFCGDLLVHLKDPITALERMRRVCKGMAIVCSPVKEHFPYRRRPVAEFNGITEFEWWVPNMAGLERWVQAAGFERIERGRPFEVRPTAGGPWKGRRGVVRGHV